MKPASRPTNREPAMSTASYKVLGFLRKGCAYRVRHAWRFRGRRCAIKDQAFFRCRRRGWRSASKPIDMLRCGSLQPGAQSTPTSDGRIRLPILDRRPPRDPSAEIPPPAREGLATHPNAKDFSHGEGFQLPASWRRGDARIGVAEMSFSPGRGAPC